jgi:Transposase IS116/IS110/IS902 family
VSTAARGDEVVAGEDFAGGPQCVEGIALAGAATSDARAPTRPARRASARAGDSRPGVCPVLVENPASSSDLGVWSHPGRLRSEAAFANLAGAAPIPASSGLTNRHRLNRGGDRQLNRALHTIVLTRSRTDPDTRAYITRRLSEGKLPETSNAASNESSPANSSDSSNTQPLTGHSSVIGVSDVSIATPIPGVKMGVVARRRR